MATLSYVQTRHRLTPPSPSFNSLLPSYNSESTHLEISKRKLPPLPISKRKLPNLPQSRSTYVKKKNACSHMKEIKSHQLSDSIVITSPVDITSDQKRESRRIRNFFSSIQIKVSGTSTKTKPKFKNNNKNVKKSKWKPNLKFICDDEELLNELITFMTAQYNEENILFLQSVNILKQNINDLLMFNATNNIVKIEKINVEIMYIYNKYITHTAEKQINLSYQCFTNINILQQKFKSFSLNEKANIFDNSVNEIQNLIQNSIIPSFYTSQEFQSIATKRNIFDNIYIQKNIHQNEIDYDSVDIEYENKNNSFQHGVCFDINSTNKWENNNKYMLSSKGFAPNSGSHEWKIKILKCSKEERRIEFGIISNFDTNIDMNKYGILDTPQWGARAVYGYNTLMKLNKNNKYKGTENNFYYASYNNDNTARCNKDLSTLNIHQKPWSKNDVIKISVNLTKSSVKFFLNGKQVRKTVSIQKNVIYYPIILYSGNCRFEIVP